MSLQISSPTSSPPPSHTMTVNNNQKKKKDIEYKTTPYVVLVCIIAASGGLLFGYDLGISGGVSAMDDFLHKFFPSVERKRYDARIDNYCKFDSQLLTLFTSSLYASSFLTSFMVSKITRQFGRKASILTGGLCFLAGSLLDGGAQNLAMLLAGRVVLGVGLGFTNQAVPLYLSEMAPPKFRGASLSVFTLCVGLGATSAYMVNYGTQHIVPWGWRLSLVLAFVPATLLTTGFLFLMDSPSSCIQRGHLDEGLSVLKRIRGTNDVQEEYNYLLQASELSKAIENPWKTIFKREYRPQLVMAFAIPFFQQVTGITIITFYLPILIQTLGFGANASLYSTILLGVITISCSLLAAYTLDKYGRRKVFFIGGSIMLFFLVLMGALLQWKLKAHNEMSKEYGIIGVVFVLLFAVGFAWSWGPLGWLVPSEIFPLEIRSAGQSINVSVSMLVVFIMAQAFLAMLCHLKATTFYFFGGWVLIMTLFTYLLFPETKGVPLEDVVNLWKEHPFWKRYYT